LVKNKLYNFCKSIKIYDYSIEGVGGGAKNDYISSSPTLHHSSDFLDEFALGSSRYPPALVSI
jgi:hypothetical protein